LLEMQPQNKAAVMVACFQTIIVANASGKRGNDARSLHRYYVHTPL